MPLPDDGIKFLWPERVMNTHGLCILNGVGQCAWNTHEVEAMCHTCEAHTRQCAHLLLWVWWLRNDKSLTSHISHQEFWHFVGSQVQIWRTNSFSVLKGGVPHTWVCPLANSETYLCYVQLRKFISKRIVVKAMKWEPFYCWRSILYDSFEEEERQ